MKKACQEKVEEVLKKLKSAVVTDETPLGFCQRYRLCANAANGLVASSQSVCDRLKYAYEHTVCFNAFFIYYLPKVNTYFTILGCF